MSRATVKLTRAQRKALDIILRIATEKRRPCFTYTELFHRWTAETDVPIKPQTLDRRIRELVKAGILERGETERGAEFCLSEDYAEKVRATPRARAIRRLRATLQERGLRLGRFIGRVGEWEAWTAWRIEGDAAEPILVLWSPVQSKARIAEPGSCGSEIHL